MWSRALLVTASCLFGSGLCALVYQTVWLRAFRLVFGASTPSTAAVLAIFLGGLGVGGLVFGRRVERAERPLVLYANLELGVAASAALTPLLVDLARAVYLAMGGSEALGGVGSTAVRLALSTVVLGVPVVLMGGTLPAAARAVTHASDVGRRGLAVLYGVNTLGAVAGVLLATFAFLEIFGARQALWIACLLNALVGLSARSAGRALPALPVADVEVRAAPMARRERWILVAAFVTGFVFLLVELVWYRMAAPLLGGSTYSFGLLLACALFGIGVGGALYAALPPKETTPARFALTCALEALFVMMPFAMGDQLAYLALHLGAWGQVSFPLTVVGWSLVTAVLVLPASIVAGYQFPLLLALKGRADHDVGKDSGELYAANTLGSIVGSLSGGFGFLPLLHALGAWRLVGALLVGVAAMAAAVGRRERGVVTLAALAAAAALVCSAARGPTAVWRHSAIGAGRAVADGTTWNERRALAHELRRAILEEHEGRESALGIHVAAGVSPLVNGKSDGSSYADAPTGVGLGVLPAVLHGAATSAYVIGLGTGQTAGWLGAVPGMQRVDVAEIEPAMTRVAELCEATNQRALANPRVKLHIADGRELLLATRERYDVIVSEPSNPYRAGIASMYSQDFYRSVATRLRPGGLLAQWVQAYEVDAVSVQMVAATLSSVFPHVSIWQLGPGDMVFLASMEPLVVDVEAVRARLAIEPYRTAFERVIGVSGAEGVLALELANERLVAALAAARGDVTTDDQPLLEFRFARSVGRMRGEDLRLPLLELAHARADDRALVRGEVSWDAVDAQRGRPFAWRNEVPPGVIGALLPEHLRAWATGRPAASVAAFAALAALDRALDPLEQAVYAAARSSLPATAAERAQLVIDLEGVRRSGHVADAAFIAVNAALTDGRMTELPALVAEAGRASALDPWPADRIVVPVLQRLGALHGADATLADALAAPYAAFNFHELRRSAAASIEAHQDEVRGQCVELVASVEPWPPWRADFLDFRRRCYERTRPALAGMASDDLATFLAHEPAGFRL
ncbi:MAG: fused MFS/spermidine synthase [Deltaproteobacteria bacterium]|nr:fused MFS/spermidine synthase [Deltaproteobacteria bacterium]